MPSYKLHKSRHLFDALEQALTLSLQDGDATPGQRVGGLRPSTPVAAHEQRGADQLVALSGRQKTGRRIRTQADRTGRLSG